MPTGESAGGVYITIDGDGSPLISQLTKAEAAAKSAGQSIAGSLNTAAASAQDLGFAAGSIVGAIERLTAVVQEEGAAATLATQRNLTLAGSFDTAGAAAGRASGGLLGATSSARILGSELRVLSGTGGLLSAERFLSSIPGVMAAANFALPLIGLAAVIELAEHGIEKFTGMSEAEKKAAENMQQLSRDTKSLNEEIAQIDTDTFRKLYGPTVTLGAKQIPQLEGQIAAQKAVIASTQAMYDAQVKARADFIKANPPQIGPGAVPTALHPPEVDKDFPALLAKQRADLDKMLAQRHAMNVDLNQSQQADNKKGDDDAKRSAEEAAADRARISEEFIEAQRDFDRREAEAKRQSEEDARKHAEAIKAAREGEVRDLAESGREMDEQIRRNADSARTASEAASREGSLAQRTGQLQVQRTGVTAESDNEVAKLQAQQTYALQIVHTKQQELQYAAQMAAFDERALQLKIATAEQELFQAVAEQNLIPTREGSLKIEEDSLKIEQAKAALAKQQIEDQTKIIELKQKTSIEDQLQVELTQQVESIAKSAGDALANGLLGKRGKKESIGQAIGQDIVNSLKSTGQHILGDIFTSAIKEALQASGVNQAAAKLGGVIFGTPANPATGAPATGGILGKLAGALHIPGVGVKPAGTPSSPAVVTGSQNTAQAAATRSATQIQQIATTTQQQERTLQQILSALTSSSCACEERQTQALTAEGAKQTALLGAIAAGIVTMTGIEILQLIKPSILGFSAAAGGYVPHDMIGQVHAGEHVLTAGQVLGNEALPNLPALAGRGIGSTSFSNAMSVNSASNSFSVGAIHLHGVRDMQDVARRLPNVLKAASSRFQPASS